MNEVIVSGLSVVLPAYNEEENVGTAVQRALEVLPALARHWEVIVVDDGSVDRTTDVMEALVEEHYPRVRLMRHEVNLGYGAALFSGFVNASKGVDVLLRAAARLLHEELPVRGDVLPQL